MGVEIFSYTGVGGSRTPGETNTALGLAESALQPSDLQQSATDRTPGRIALAENVSTLSTALDLVAYDLSSGSGAVRGTTTDSGHTWNTTGTGYLTTVFHEDGYITGTENTYCIINTGKKVNRYTQRFMGPLCTCAILLQESLTDMLHVNFNSGGYVSATYWRENVPNQELNFWGNVAAIPVLTDGPHDCTVDIFGPYINCFVDGIHVFHGRLEILDSVAGVSIFAQIHANAGDRIYGIKTYSLDSGVSDTDKPPIIDASHIKANTFTAKAFNFGDTQDAYYQAPKNPLSFHVKDEMVVTSSDVATIRAKAVRTGYSAKFIAQNQQGSELTIAALYPTGYISYGGVNRIQFPLAITNQVIFPTRILASGLPTSASGLSSGELWVDTAANNVVKRVP